MTFFFYFIFFLKFSINAAVSVGPEAAVVIIGASSVKFIERWFKLDMKRKRVVTLSAVAGACTTFLGSPISGFVSRKQ